MDETFWVHFKNRGRTLAQEISLSSLLVMGPEFSQGRPCPVAQCYFHEWPGRIRNGAAETTSNQIDVPQMTTAQEIFQT